MYFCQQKKSSPAPRSSDQAPKDAIKLADKLGPCVIHPAEVQPGPLAEAPALRSGVKSTGHVEIN
jgi:hypothetical protein